MTDHPIDSQYHPCCRSIGGHGRDCPQGPNAIFAAAADDQPAADHDVAVLHNTAHTWCCACSCGCRSLDYIAEHAARHYLAAGGSSDDDSAELLAAMRRHPSIQGGAQ